MKRFLTATALCAAFLGLPVIAAADSPYSNGPVWDIAQIKTKDGHFDDYIKWVDTVWKAQQEELMKQGYIIGYKVYETIDPREGEPDILLATEYKNMAVMDTPVATMDAFFAKFAGSLKKSDEREAARGSIRTVQGDILFRELKLK